MGGLGEGCNKPYNQQMSCIINLALTAVCSLGWPTSLPNHTTPVGATTSPGAAGDGWQVALQLQCNGTVKGGRAGRGWRSLSRRRERGRGVRDAQPTFPPGFWRCFSFFSHFNGRLVRLGLSGMFDPIGLPAHTAHHT